MNPGRLRGSIMVIIVFGGFWIWLEIRVRFLELHVRSSSKYVGMTGSSLENEAPALSCVSLISNSFEALHVTKNG